MKKMRNINESLSDRISNAIRGFKYSSDQLNQMDIDNQTFHANDKKYDKLKNKMYGIDDNLYHAFNNFSYVCLDNIFWGDDVMKSNQYKKLQMLQNQILRYYDELRKINPTQLREGIGGAWWGFKNKDKDIDSLERNKKYVDRHFDSIGATNEEIDKAIRLIDVITNLLYQFINLYSSCGSEETRKHGWHQQGYEYSQTLYDELNRYKYKLNLFKNEVAEKLWTRDKINNTTTEGKMKNNRTIRLTESRLRGMIHEAVRVALNEISQLTMHNVEGEFVKEINAMMQALENGKQTGKYQWTQRYYEKKKRNPQLTPQAYMQQLNRGLETARSGYNKDEFIDELADAINVNRSLFRQILSDDEVYNESYRFGIDPGKCKKYSSSDPQIVKKINNLGNISYGGGRKGFLGMGSKPDSWGVHEKDPNSKPLLKGQPGSAMQYNGEFSNFAGL